MGSSKSCSLKYQVVVDGRGVALGLVRPRPFLMLQQLHLSQHFHQVQLELDLLLQLKKVYILFVDNL